MIEGGTNKILKTKNVATISNLIIESFKNHLGRAPTGVPGAIFCKTLQDSIEILTVNDYTYCTVVQILFFPNFQTKKVATI
jgi:hypothetical protein